MDEDAYDMAMVYANAEPLLAVKKFKGKDGKINMCKGLAGLIEDGKDEGRKEGKAEGRIGMIADFLSNGGTNEMAENLLNASAEEIEQAKKRL